MKMATRIDPRQAEARASVSIALRMMGRMMSPSEMRRQADRLIEAAAKLHELAEERETHDDDEDADDGA